MLTRRMRTGFATMLALLIAAAGNAAADAGQPEEASYRDSLWELSAYRTCTFSAFVSDESRPLVAEVRAIERLGRSKGLSRTLQRIHEAFERERDAAPPFRCDGGPEAVVSRARRAVAAFRAWVEGAPTRSLTPAEAEEADGQDLLSADQTYADAVAQRDEETLRQIAHDSFTIDWGDGRIGRLADLIRTVASTNMSDQRVAERTVLVRGDTGRVSGTAVLDFQNARPPFTRRYRYEASFRRRRGNWLLVGVRMTRLRGAERPPQ